MNALRLKELFIAIPLYITSFYCYSQAPNWVWGKTASGNGDLNSIAIGSSGNIYSAGVFGPNNMVFETTTLSLNFGGTSDLFLTKHTPVGNLIWARQSSIIASCRAVAIAADAADNVYMVGDYTGGMTLDTCGLNSFPNNNTDNVFVTKFNSSGNVMWARRVGGNYYSNSYALAIDNNGNVFITGTFQGQYITFNSITLQNPYQPTGGGGCMFLAKYDTNGAILWARNTTGNSGTSQVAWPSGLVADATGNIYLTGQFSTPSVGFSSTVSLNNGGGTDAFLVKYNSNGNALWARKGSGNSYEYSAGTTIDSNGDILVTGQFESGSLQFGSTSLTNTITTWDDDNIFLVKYNSSGNVVWARSNKYKAWPKAISSDNSGNSYVLGSYRDSIIFGNNTLKYPNQLGDIFLAKYDVNGNAVWGKNTTIIKAQTGNSFIMPHALSQKVTSDLYFGGGFDCKRMKLDTCLISNSDTTGNSRAIIIGKINTTYVGLSKIEKEQVLPDIYPNPFQKWIIIKLKDKTIQTFTIKIYDMAGKIITSVDSSNGILELNSEDIKPGIYFAEVLHSSIVLGRTKIIKH
jgi:hypothetical protein